MDNLTPVEMAEYVHASGDLIFNPYEKGTDDCGLFVDRLLELTSEAGNDD